MPFVPPYLYIIAVSFLISLTVYYKPDPRYNYLKLFAPFLLATFCAEFYGNYLVYKNRPNIVLYNFFSAFEFFFYVFILSIVISKPRIKLLTRITAFAYIILAVGNILFVQGMKSFHTVTYSLGCLLVVIFCIYYFLELFRVPKSVALKNNPAFWICSGLLFFYCCSFPLYSLVNFWGSNIPPFIFQNFDAIFAILNIFLYSLFSISFLCLRTRRYTSLSS